MSTEVRPPAGRNAARLSQTINRLAGWLSRHWLAVFNVFVFIFMGLPFLAPILMDAGATGPANLIYSAYAPACHQLPERSFFLFGREVVYSAEELEHNHFLPEGLNILERQSLRWPGSVEAGFKVALCQRDLAIYGSLLVAGLAFGAVRSRWPRKGNKMRKMPIWLYVVLLLPIAIDGVSQLFGLRESVWELRLITGAIMGVATVLLAYPYVEEAMQDVARTAERDAQNWTKEAQ